MNRNQEKAMFAKQGNKGSSRIHSSISSKNMKGNRDSDIKEMHWTKKLEINKIIPIDDHDIKMIYYNRKPEGHFFDKDTMRYFDSRIGKGYKLNGNIYFITSEQQHESQEFGGDRPRKWNIRVMNKEGNIDTIGEFQQYKNQESAKRDLDKILEAEMKNYAYTH